MTKPVSISDELRKIAVLLREESKAQKVARLEKKALLASALLGLELLARKVTR